MKKSTFDFKPQLVDYEGAVVRINFDVEKVTESFPSMGDGEPVEREVFKACVVRVPQPLTVEAVKAALLAEGFSEIKANAVATEAIFIIDGSNDLGKAKAMVLAKITEYDNSDDVNGFTLGGKQHWIPREYRVIYGDRLAQEMRREHESVSFDLPDAQPGDAPLTLDVAILRRSTLTQCLQSKSYGDNTPYHITGTGCALRGRNHTRNERVA